MKYTIPIKPMGKPRMTKADRWKQRKCVQKYWDFKAEMQGHCKKIPDDPHEVSWVAYFPIPKSWPKYKKKAMAGAYHRQKPDRDNVDKAILDAIFDDDSIICKGTIIKRWDDGDGPRIELEIL